MATHYGKYSTDISTNGLILRLDATKSSSYPGSGTTWYDISGNNNNFVINATAYNVNGGYMDFNGSYGCAKKAGGDLSISGDVSVVCWTRIKTSTAEWRTLLRGLSSGADHQVIVQSGGYNMGMYDNVNGTGFNNSGYSQQSLPGWDTGTWNMLVWRWNNSVSPYYNFSINDTPNVIRGSIASVNSRFKHGICSIGAYNNGNQSDPSTASQYWGDIAKISIYNRYITNGEIQKAFTIDRSRFGV